MTEKNSSSISFTIGLVITIGMDHYIIRILGGKNLSKNSSMSFVYVEMDASDNSLKHVLFPLSERIGTNTSLPY